MTNQSEIEAKIINLNKKAMQLFEDKNCFNKEGYENYVYDYWRKIFPSELALVKCQAQVDSKYLRLPDKPVMILTLGTSFEPLVLAVGLTNPECVYVLYTDDKLLEGFKGKLADTLSFDKVKPLRIIRNQLNPNEAATLFKLLRDKLKPEDNEEKLSHKELIALLNNEVNKKRIIFDITGAKKTISGGCLLFASYYDIPVFYMDFNEKYYNAELGRPMPGACRYSRQSNPISGFRLKDLSEIGTAFNDGRYDTSRTLLTTAIPKMDTEYFDKEEKDFFISLDKLCQIYQKWNDGWWGDISTSDMHPQRDYTKCLNKYPKVSDYKEPKYQTDFYDDLNSFVSYLVLETATLFRLNSARAIQPRSLFLRCYGLEEILLGFIFYRLHQKNNLPCTTNIINNSIPSDLSDDDHIKLALCQNYKQLEMVLLGWIKKGFTTSISKPKWYTGNDLWDFKNNRHEVSVGKIQDMTKVFLLSKVIKYFFDNRNLRNGAVHRITPVNDQEAGAVLKHLHNLLSTLLEDMYWFGNCDQAQRAQALIRQNEWYKDEAVAPTSWERAIIIIQAAVAATQSYQGGLA